MPWQGPFPITMITISTALQVTVLDNLSPWLSDMSHHYQRWAFPLPLDIVVIGLLLISHYKVCWFLTTKLKGKGNAHLWSWTNINFQVMIVMIWITLLFFALVSQAESLPEFRSPKVVVKRSPYTDYCSYCNCSSYCCSRSLCAARRGKREVTEEES